MDDHGAVDRAIAAAPRYRYVNVPSEVDAFIGHERELSRLCHLQAQTHLLTFVGPGAVGKTRLELWLQAEVGHGFSDSIWLVDLRLDRHHGSHQGSAGAIHTRFSACPSLRRLWKCRVALPRQIPLSTALAAAVARMQLGTEFVDCQTVGVSEPDGFAGSESAAREADSRLAESIGWLKVRPPSNVR